MPIKLTMTICLLAVSPQLSTASAQNTATQARPCRNGPMIKNLMAPGTPACDPAATVSQEPSRRQIKELDRTAKTAEEHLTVSRYYKAEADKLDAEAAAYEQAAASYRQSPSPKNLMAPSTPGRYEYSAKGYREEAKVYRERAALQEQMANDAVESPK
jgi:hypothetical protein